MRHVFRFPAVRPSLLLALAAAVCLAAPPADAQRSQRGQTPEAPIIDQVSVEVVNVDVIVTDAKGRPVTGLTADDFEVREDGKARPISNFFAFRQGSLRLDDDGVVEEQKDWPDQRMRRRVALLFDNNSLEKRHRDQVIEQLERFVLEQFDGTYEWAVVAYSDDLQLMQPFTSDKTTVLGALGRVSDLPIPVRRRRAADSTYTESLPGVRRNGDNNPGSRGIQREFGGKVSMADFELRERVANGLDMFSRTANAVVQTMRAHMGMDGRKSLILVAGQAALVPGGDQMLGRGIPGVGIERDTTDPLISVYHAELLRRYQAMIRVANASGFSIYPVAGDEVMKSTSPYLDVSRNINIASTGGISSAPAQLDLEGSSRTLAVNTGGRFYSTSRFYDAFDDIDDRTANSYVLGFTTDHGSEGKYHDIEVKAKKPGLKVFHREGYLHLSRRDQIAEELATPLAFPKDRGDFEIDVQLFPPQATRRKNVDVTVAGLMPMDKITLIPQGEDLVGRVHVFIALYDPEGELVSLVREQQDVRLKAAMLAEAPADTPARFGLKLNKVPRGDYTVTVTLIDDITNTYGTDLQAIRL